MKKRKLAAVWIGLSLMLTACGNTAETDQLLSEEVGADFADAIDVDLTQLSSTMVYSQVYDMMEEPERYIGQTVKMSGTFSVYEDESSGNIYFSCMVQDATACCAQGIEFVLSDATYPDDYPKEGDEISVVGVFDTYEEDEYTYCTLRNAKLV